MSFGAANEMVRKFSNLGTYQVMVIDLLDVPHMDGSAALALEEVIQRAVKADKSVFVAGMTTPVRNLMRRLDSLKLVPETRLINTRSEAVGAVIEELQKQGLTEP